MNERQPAGGREGRGCLGAEWLYTHTHGLLLRKGNKSAKSTRLSIFSTNCAPLTLYSSRESMRCARDRLFNNQPLDLMQIYNNKITFQRREVARACSPRAAHITHQNVNGEWRFSAYAPIRDPP